MASPYNAFTITFFFLISTLFLTHHVCSFAMHRKTALPEEYEMINLDDDKSMMEKHEPEEYNLMMEKPEQEEYEMIKPEKHDVHPADKLMMEKHERWIADHGRVYKDAAEKERRFRIFKENVEHIEAFNRDESNGFKLAVNHFADLTDEEFRNSYLNNVGYNLSLETTGSDSSVSTEYYGYYNRRRSYNNFKYANVRRLPRRVDWRERGAVTPIKQQGQCGSCYIFSCIGAVEGINAITSGRLISLSEQELLDCDNQNYHCRGGFPGNSFNFIRNHGITAEQYYPYRGYQGYCQNRASEPVVRIKGYERVPSNSEVDMMKAVANQPISVSLDGGDRNFRYYGQGVFRARCGTRLDHAVTVVGYGVANNGLKYWIVKNSWGTNWGENGYGYLLRDTQDPRGICGIAMRASFPIM